MSSKRKFKGRHLGNYEDVIKPTPFDLNVANYLHKHLISIEGKLSGCRVNIFYPSEAVDLLLKSQWSDSKIKPREQDAVQFSSEDSAVKFMSRLLLKNLISRAIKVQRKTLNRKKDVEKKKLKPKKSLELKVKTDKLEGDAPSTEPEQRKPSTELPPKLKSSKPSTEVSLPFGFSLFSSSASSKPIRLEYTEEQIFTLEDPETVYVWIYDPPPGLKAWLLGTVLILGIIFCCFFPIWPWQLRQGAYYVTLGILAFLCVLFIAALIRLLLYVCVLMFSIGKFKFWLFPNFFEDCGFFESFRPVYSLEHVVRCNDGCNVDEKRIKKKRTLLQELSNEAGTPATDLEISPKCAPQQSESEKFAVGKQD